MENILEEGRGYRNRKKQSDPICCPICGITLRQSEIDQHCELEIDRLNKFQLNQKLKKPVSNGNAAFHDPIPGCSSNGDENSGCPWLTFQRVRNNRHSRLKIKTRKRKADDPICPICNEKPTEDINLHVELCLRKSEGSDLKLNGIQSDDDVDIEGESYEEYEWAGQKRVRVSSLLEGGYTAAGIGTSISNCSNDDEDEDLNVDGDDTQIYGPPQYTEKDIIIPISADCEKEEHESIYLRKLVTGQDISTNLHSSRVSSTNEDRFHDKDEEDNNLRLVDDKSTNESETITDCNRSKQVVESLKIKIREYENQISNKLKCLICMDEFRNPAVSICCWHVHCEECWLKTLGARKLCPQCNMITSATDLRRIYM